MSDEPRTPSTERLSSSDSDTDSQPPRQPVHHVYRGNGVIGTMQAQPSLVAPGQAGGRPTNTATLTTRVPTYAALRQVIPEWQDEWDPQVENTAARNLQGLVDDDMNMPPHPAAPPQGDVGGDVNGSLQEMVSDPSVESAENDDAYAFETAEETTLGLREISPLATWTVSTHKPHCGAPALLHPTASTFWQSDGPQPHLLTAHFPRTVTILKLRIYLDFALDESYTPTRMEFWGGLHGADYGLVQFGEWKGEEPRGWQEVELEGCGPGGRDEVRCRVLQVRVAENHQNGKDTHVRGVQVFARDERVRTPAGAKEDEEEEGEGEGAKKGVERDFVGVEPDWMGDPEIR